MFPLLAVMQQSIPKVSAALRGTFTPYSKEFSHSDGVSDTFQMPPNKDGQTGTASMNISYTLTVGNPEEVEAVIIPPGDYDKWMPEAGDDENSDGNKLDVKVILQKKGQPGSKPAQGATFKFELVDVSKEPGICLNWPPKAQVKDPPDFDLKIDKDNPYFDRKLPNNPAEDGQSATSKGNLKEVTLSIVSHDYGAWGKLKVTATLEKDKTTIVAHLKDKPDIEVLSIPEDNNGNHVADAWEEIVAPPGAAADSDDDSHPKGNGDAGDALSLYEEYRGFMINGQHFRTDPNYKDVFVDDMDDMTTGSYDASGIDVHVVRHEEINFNWSTRNHETINFNHGFAHLGDKYVLWLKDNAKLREQGFLGLARCGPADHLKPGLPKTCASIDVALDSALGEPRQGQDRFVVLRQVVAHELAHGTNVWHHGDTDYKVNYVYKPSAGGDLYQYKGPWSVAATGGQESGVQECIMRYYGPSCYESENGHWSWYRGLSMVHGESYPPIEAPGTIFCDSKTGTGVNDPKGGTLQDGRNLPKAGNATRGDCMHQFSVNDLK